MQYYTAGLYFNSSKAKAVASSSRRQRKQRQAAPALADAEAVATAVAAAATPAALPDSSIPAASVTDAADDNACGAVPQCASSASSSDMHAAAAAVASAAAAVTTAPPASRAAASSTKAALQPSKQLPHKRALTPLSQWSTASNTAWVKALQRCDRALAAEYLTPAPLLPLQ
jgi:hypothetical protein